MRAGQLDRRVTLLKRSISRDSFGEAVEAFVDLDTVWARVIHDRSGELSRQNDAQRQAQSVVTFRVRWRGDIDRTMRVRWEGAEYDITNIMEVGRRAGLDLQATASVP